MFAFLNQAVTGVFLAMYYDPSPTQAYESIRYTTNEAFLGEFVPNIGPVATSLPALFVAAGQGAGTFGLALAAILFVQQVETALLVPLIMGKELDLHPVELFFWTLAAGTLFGLVGALLAVPVAALVRILVDEFYLRPRRLEMPAIDAAAGRLAEGETDVAK